MKIAIITGPRVVSAQDERLVRSVVREVVARGFSVYVGDAAGVDDIVSRECFACDSLPRVFVPVAQLGRSPAGLAERSTHMVKEGVAASWEHFSFQDEIVCIGFPNKPCPARIVPARSWKSGGSGTWSTLALAIGHEIETWMFPLDEMILSPLWCGAPQQFTHDFIGWHYNPASLF